MLGQSTKIKIGYLYVPFGIHKYILQLQEVIICVKMTPKIGNNGAQFQIYLQNTNNSS